MRRAFVVVALLAGTAFVFVTPPFQVPDEVGHYWRAVGIAEGQIGGPDVRLPRSAQTLVYTLWVETAGRPAVKFDRARLWRASAIAYDDRDRVTLRAIAPYTIVPSLPQAAACLIGRIFRIRPLVTFYLGRLLNLGAFVALVAAAMTIAPEAAFVFAAAGLLPMSLFLAGSFSPDAATIGATFVLIALVLRPASERAVAAGAFLAALCKPPYFLAALLGARTRRRTAILVVSIVAGASISFAVASHAFRPRSNVPVDPRAQLHFIAADPLRYAAVTARDFEAHGREYGEEMIGVLGWLDVRLPGFVVLLAALLLIATAVTSGLTATVRMRIGAVAIVIACAGAISLSQYLTWTPAGADFVGGIQGRYFLPILPLLLIAIGARWRPLPPWTIVIAFLIINFIAINAVVLRYGS